MNKINHNNLETVKTYLGNVQSKKTEKEEKKEETKLVKEFEPKKVEASALDAVAAQILGTQLSKIDKSDEATSKRIEQAFAGSAFMKSLNELQGFEQDFTAFAMANITGVDKVKLGKYLEKPLSENTKDGIKNYFNKLIA